MPALRAIVSVEVPSRPCSPNSSSATARISSRRSSAVLRAGVAGFTPWKLALTHNACQALLPAPPGAEQVLRVAAERGRRGERLVGERVAEEAARVAPGVDV